MGQRYKNHLGDIFGGGGIAQLAEALRMNRVEVGLDKAFKRLGRAGPDVFTQRVVHGVIYHTP